MGKSFAVLLLTLIIGSSAAAQSYTISGYIKDAVTGEVLIGANLYNSLEENGTATNAYGFFSYTTSRDSVSLLISYVGYTTERISFHINKNLVLDIELTPGNELEEIEVRPELNIEESTQMSRIKIGVDRIKSMPVMLGEVDVLKALQMLPGVQSGTEGTSGLYVRGGGPDQNLILIDGVPVYNASHLFGFFSVFNADAINHIEMVKGGFPARYGGRLSSVIDITLKEGNRERIKGEGSIGLISSKLTVDGPISENTTFLLSGRRTYIDLLARPIIKNQTDGDEVAGYYFYDLNAKINHKISAKDRIYLSAYLGNDKAYAISEYDHTNQQVHTYTRDEFGLKWGNLTTALRWNHIFGPRLFGNLTLTYSRYAFNIFNEFEENERSDTENYRSFQSAEYNSGINDLALKADFEFNPVPEHHIKYGLSATRHEFNPGVMAFISDAEIDTSLGSNSIYTSEFFAYAEDDFKVTDKLKLNLGMHLSAFLVDNKFYHSFEPRVAFNIGLPSRMALKGSYTRMTQYIHLLTNTGIGLPTDLWVPSTNNIKPQSANQFAIGLAKGMDEAEITLEAYYKTMSGLIEYEEGATYLSLEDNWQDKVTSGNGESYGAELFIQKTLGKWSGWLGYTLSWNYRQFDDVNFGEKYPYKYDRRHDISVIASYKPKQGLELSANWVYGTGSAFSLPLSEYPGYIQNLQAGIPVQHIEHYSGRNGMRMPSYHRLDISASWTKQKKWGERTWSLGLYNAYNRKNPFFIDTQFDHSEEKTKFVQYSIFPILPSITYSFKF